MVLGDIFLDLLIFLGDSTWLSLGSLFLGVSILSYALNPCNLSRAFVMTLIYCPLSVCAPAMTAAMLRESDSNELSRLINLWEIFFRLTNLFSATIRSTVSLDRVLSSGTCLCRRFSLEGVIFWLLKAAPDLGWMVVWLKVFSYCLARGDTKAYLYFGWDSLNDGIPFGGIACLLVGDGINAIWKLVFWSLKFSWAYWSENMPSSILSLEVFWADDYLVAEFGSIPKGLF